ncbi:MAG TPA: phenylalanine--tRNA ligase subunit beta [Casimicrobiaceae bacterium]|nr:phenylalanine--tRNA ligase subunit beta [Casimicrobiaceae bacterium]
MRISENWLRTFVDPPLDSAALCERLTMTGLEVEARESVAPPFAGVVAARVERVAAHPNAERLRICSVDAGDGSHHQVVCGAPNVVEGMIVPFARVGASLPDDVAIRRATFGGLASDGMLCSARELGISDDASGLLALPSNTKPGTDVRSALSLDDTLITLKLTPNRADCLSILGIARDVSASTAAALNQPDIDAPSVTSKAAHRVRVVEPIACPRFVSRVIEGVDATAPTPDWMKARLERCGMRAISAIVDITNYVMLEIGQPLHAYDRALLEGDIVVRFARNDEKLLLLNGDTLDLAADLLLVADEKKPLGLAGVMGGEYSAIADTTRDVLLEGAFWNPAVIAGRMGRLGFVSDAGHRFERGVDFELQRAGVDRATQLMLDICGGRAGPLNDVKASLPRRDPVHVRTKRVERLLGVPLASADIAQVFTRLRLAFVRDGDDFIVTPPSYRFDLAIEEDFVEEVARIRGFDSIPAAVASHPSTMLATLETKLSLAALRARLVARDWHEVVTMSFVDAGVQRALDPASVAIEVRNPIASHMSVMRSSLLPGLIATLQANVARRESRVRVFESGRVFLEARADAASQPLRLGGVAFGLALPEQWGAATRTVDIFDLKADLAALVHPRALTTERVIHPALHRGRSARVLVDGRDAGYLGELDPRLARDFGLHSVPIVFELSLDILIERELPRAQVLSRQPVVRRDFAVVVDDSIATGELLAALEATKPPHVVALQPFDVYRGDKLPTGRKSVAILVLMQDTQRTLTDADIDTTVAQMVSLLGEKFGVTLRT